MSGRTFICVFLYSTTQAHEEICHPSRNGHNKRYGRFVFASSRMSSVALAVKKAGEMLNDGASILDIGGCSTRPGCKVVDAETEKERVIPAIKAISEHFPGTEISVDTFRSEIAVMAADAGATIINDISGGDFDNDMFPAVASLGLPYILMHTKGMPDEMVSNAHYKDVTGEVAAHISAGSKNSGLWASTIS